MNKTIGAATTKTARVSVNMLSNTQPRELEERRENKVRWE